MSTTTEFNANTATTITFAEGRALDECVGGLDKVSVAEAKKQEKQEKQLAAAAKKALKEAEKQRKLEEKALKEAEKQRKLEEKAAKAEAIAAKKAEKEAEKQRKLKEKAAKVEANAAKKAEKEAEKQRKLEEKAAKAEANAAKKAERDAKKAERDAKKAERDAKKAERDAKISKLTSSAGMQAGEIETLLHPVSDNQAAEVSEIAIITTESPKQSIESDLVNITVHPPPELAILSGPVPSALIDFNSYKENSPVEKPHCPPELIGNTNHEINNTIAEQQAPVVNDAITPTSETKKEVLVEEDLVEEEWDKEIYGNETDVEKIARLRKQSNELFRRARELEKSLPTELHADFNANNDDDMREIDGVMYRIDDEYIYNRYDEMVGFIELGDKITFRTNWDPSLGDWSH